MRKFGWDGCPLHEWWGKMQYAILITAHAYAPERTCGPPPASGRIARRPQRVAGWKLCPRAGEFPNPVGDRHQLPRVGRDWRMDGFSTEVSMCTEPESKTYPAACHGPSQHNIPNVVHLTCHVNDKNATVVRASSVRRRAGVACAACGAVPAERGCGGLAGQP